MKLKWEVGSGIDEYIGELQKLGQYSESMCGKAIYQGAKVVADAVRKNIQSLPVQEVHWSKKGALTAKVSGVTASQKQGLLDGFGIAHKKNDNGYIHVKLGMDGYNSTVTKKYPSGQPNAMVARFVESGNSYHKKTPFIDPAVNSTKALAEKKMQLAIDEEIETIIK